MSKSMRPDGGASPFEVVADEQISREDRFREIYDEFVRAPITILLSDWRAVIGLAIIGLYVLMGTIGVLLVREPEANQAPRLAKPFESSAYPLGTDALGQDIFAQIVHATPPMLQMILAGAVFSITVATVVGIVSGYVGGKTDTALMSFTDIMLTLPGLPLVIVIAAVVNPRNPYLIGVILAINAWAGLARALRSQVLTLRELEYVEASQTLGIPTWRIMLKDVLPNLMPYITVNFVGAARAIVFSSVALYFLGVLPFSTLNWGVMMNLAYETAGALYTWNTAHWLIMPMFTILLLSFGLILFAQGTDRIFNPRVRARHAKTIGDSEAEDPDQSDAAITKMNTQ